MRTLLSAVFLVLCQQLSSGQGQPHAAAYRPLLGAWHLVEMQEPAAGGKLQRINDRQGSLIYTPDGHMSVQLMLPAAEANLNSDYVKNGYEASFGTYDVDEKAHTVTHHVQGSVTRGLIGKDLPRLFEIKGKRMLIRSTRADEHWFVTWEHD